MILSVLAKRCAQIRPQKFHLVLPLLIMALLYAISSLPGTPFPDRPVVYDLFYWLSPVVQNLLHVPAYAALGWAWRWSLGAWLRSSSAMAAIAGTISIGYGVLDEWHQSFVPGRTASLTDVLSDVIGVAVGLWIFHEGRGILARLARRGAV